MGLVLTVPSLAARRAGSMRTASRIWQVKHSANSGHPLLALELRDEGAACRTRRRVLSIHHLHRKRHIAGNALDADLDQRAALDIGLHHVQGHMSPPQPRLEEGALGSKI